jgi:hypothetical protein
MQERTAEEVTAAVAEKIGALAVRLATGDEPAAGRRIFN